MFTMPRLALIGVFLCLTVPAHGADDKAADKLLAEARKAAADKNYPAASQRYKEFLAQIANHKDAPAARHGLALALLELPDADYTAAGEQLQMLAGSKELAEYPSVLYHLGIAKRGLGLRDKTKASTGPAQEAAPLYAAAQKHFEEAAKQFGMAAQVFTDRAKKADGQEPKPDQEWAFRSRLAEAEMLLQSDKGKEAQAITGLLLKDKALAKGRNQRLALYYDGWARFLQKDYLGAGKALNVIVSFGDAEFGTHARYLLARVHHLDDERAEAAGHYEGVLADFAAHKKNAQSVLRRPDLLRNNPREKLRLEALMKAPLPDHVARSRFYLGVLRSEGGRFSDAQALFDVFIKSSPRSPLVPESLLRRGICLVNMKQYNEAIQLLQPLVAREPKLADVTLFWLGKAIAGIGDRANPAAYQQVMKRAADTLRQAADKAKEREAADADAKARRGTILLELGDTYLLAGQAKEAVSTYEQVLTDKLLPGKDQELQQRLADALNLAGDYAASDKVCARFIQAYPKSPFLPAVLFRHAENAAFALLAAKKNAQLPDRDKELARLAAEANQRYQAVVAQFPEYEYANLARYGLAVALLGKGELEKAKNMLAAISGSERTGELATASYLQADCMIRLAPTKVDDALGAGQVQELMTGAIEALEAFLNSQPKGPLAADALLKLGYCNQRLAALQAQPAEKAKLLTAARVAYKKLYAEFPRDQMLPYAVFEEAKCFIHLGAVPRALANLTRFVNDPALKQSPIAPMALLNLATLLRGQNKPGDAAGVLMQAVQNYGPALQKDPARAAWLPLLQLHLGICQREAGKLPEARGLFESIGKEFPNRPEAAEAALRRGQCLKDEARPGYSKAWARLVTANLNPQELAQAQQEMTAAIKPFADAAKYLEDQAEALKAKQPASEARARMLYEAAWAQRLIAVAEIQLVRTKQGDDKPIPVQPAEKKMRDLYQALIAGFGEHPLSVDARLELGEMLADRDDPTGAIKLFSDAIDQEPSPEMTDKLRFRLGAALAAKGDAKNAQTQLETVAKNPKSLLHTTANSMLKLLKENKPLPALPNLAGEKPDRASLDDATAGVSLATVSAPVAAQRTKPAPFARLSLPDPYEFHYAIRLPVEQNEDIFPLPATWPPGS